MRTKVLESEDAVRRIIFFLLGIFFFVLGCVGLVIPIIPQIPFFIIAMYFFAESSTWVKKKILSSKFYNSIVLKKADAIAKMKKKKIIE